MPERENWTSFTWDDATILPLLGDVRFAQGKLLGSMENVGFNPSATWKARLLTDQIVASSEIEGVRLDPRGVRSSVARRLGLPDETEGAASREIDGAVEILLDATKNAAAPLSADRLLGWHAALFPTGYSGLRRITAGSWRDTPMEVLSGPIGHERVHYRAPEAGRVDVLMREFIRWFNDADGTDRTLRAGIAHLWFLTIHPFEDGNGRIARALTEMLLARSDGGSRRFYTMAGYILSRREDYYRELEAAQRGTPNVTRWLQWFPGALSGSIRTSESELENALAQGALWASLENVSLNARQRKVLAKLMNGFEEKLTAQKWARICKVSADTALRDINDLIAKGILVRDPAGGRSTSYSMKL